MNLRKHIVQWMILGTALGLYQIYGVSAWEAYLAQSGAPQGTFEVALGYTFVFAVAGVFSWWITKSMKDKEHKQ